MNQIEPDKFPELSVKKHPSTLFSSVLQESECVKFIIKDVHMCTNLDYWTDGPDINLDLKL